MDAIAMELLTGLHRHQRGPGLAETLDRVRTVARLARELCEALDCMAACGVVEGWRNDLDDLRRLGTQSAISDHTVAILSATLERADTGALHPLEQLADSAEATVAAAMQNGMRRGPGRLYARTEPNPRALMVWQIADLLERRRNWSASRRGSVAALNEAAGALWDYATGEGFVGLGDLARYCTAEVKARRHVAAGRAALAGLDDGEAEEQEFRLQEEADLIRYG